MLIKLTIPLLITLLGIGIFNSLALYLFFGALIALCGISIYNFKKQNYWKVRNIKSPPSEFIFGHARSLFSMKYPRWLFLDELYKNFYSEGMCGIYEFSTPVLLAIDVNVVHRILVKDFNHFEDRFSFNLGSKKDKFVGNLISVLPSEKWKILKAVITPAFSPSKIRCMYPLMVESVNFFIDDLKTKSGTNISTSEHMKELTLNVIAQCAFGVDLKKSPGKAKEILKFAKNSVPFIDVKKMPINRAFPQLFTWLGLRFSVPSMDYFEGLCNEILKQKKQSQSSRGDFIDILLDTLSKDDCSINEEIIISQTMMFLLAGYETTATTLTIATFLLAKHPNIQERIRKEIMLIEKEGDEFSYDGIMQNVLLEAIVYETLRIYPVATFLQRLCTKEYFLPDADLVIPEGMPVVIPIWSIHHDARYWKNPDEYNPNRFIVDGSLNKEKLHFLAFGQGPRNCIGQRIALMESKLSLAKIISNFRIEMVEGYENLELCNAPILPKPKSEVYLKFISIQK